ncbi:hypothetical protein ACQ5SO_09025 [Rhodovulum sp. DZ06]|uniref:hypothetical protein n=1 Tax=Rhodovulum sp. DZ06 TaxID=3425126 RepID=UPI003D32B5CC
MTGEMTEAILGAGALIGLFLFAFLLMRAGARGKQGRGGGGASGYVPPGWHAGRDGGGDGGGGDSGGGGWD